MSHTSPLSSYKPSTLVEERAISLLGAGVLPTQVAATLGVTDSAISQLLSQSEFASAVAQLKFQSLQKHNERDAKYDSIEDTLLAKLETSVSMMYKPHEILKAIQVINGAKRRGVSQTENISSQQTVVQVVLPSKVVSQFTVNAQNQVTQAGSQSLITIQSGELLRRAEADSPTQGEQSERKQITYAHHTISSHTLPETSSREQESSSCITSETPRTTFLTKRALEVSDI